MWGFKSFFPQKISKYAYFWFLQRYMPASGFVKPFAGIISFSLKLVGAEDGTWTHTSIRPLPPQSSVSAIPPPPQVMCVSLTTIRLYQKTYNLSIPFLNFFHLLFSSQAADPQKTLNFRPFSKKLCREIFISLHKNCEISCPRPRRLQRVRQPPKAHRAQVQGPSPRYPA